MDMIFLNEIFNQFTIPTRNSYLKNILSKISYLFLLCYQMTSLKKYNEIYALIHCTIGKFYLGDLSPIISENQGKNSF